MNTDSQHVCHVAILGENHNLPWRAVRVCFENQVDFNYLDVDDLRHHAQSGADGITIADQHYHALIVDGDPPPGAESQIETLENAGRVIHWDDNGSASLEQLRKIVPKDVRVTPASPGLRTRQVQKAGMDWFILFNEGGSVLDVTLETQASGPAVLMDPQTGAQTSFEGRLQLDEHALRVLVM